MRPTYIIAFVAASITFTQLAAAQTSQTPEPIGRNDWVRQPGDQPGPRSGMNMGMPGGSGAQSMGGGGHMGGGTIPGPGTHGHSSSSKPGETKELQQMQHNMPATPSHSGGPGTGKPGQ